MFLSNLGQFVPQHENNEYYSETTHEAIKQLLPNKSYATRKNAVAAMHSLFWKEKSKKQDDGSKVYEDVFTSYSLIATTRNTLDSKGNEAQATVEFVANAKRKALLVVNESLGLTLKSSKKAGDFPVEIIKWLQDLHAIRGNITHLNRAVSGDLEMIMIAQVTRIPFRSSVENRNVYVTPSDWFTAFLQVFGEEKLKEEHIMMLNLTPRDIREYLLTEAKAYQQRDSSNPITTANNASNDDDTTQAEENKEPELLSIDATADLIGITSKEVRSILKDNKMLDKMPRSNSELCIDDDVLNRIIAVHETATVSASN